MLGDDIINIVVQINGKKEDYLKLKKYDGRRVNGNNKKNKNINKYLEGKKEIKKIIFIKNKILNIIVNWWMFWNILRSIYFFLFYLAVDTARFTKNINDVNFKINFSQMNGVREVNNKVKSNLKQYTLNDSQKIYNISTTSKYNKEIITKDASGAATEFKIYLDIAFEVSSKNYNKIFNFSRKF